jgi:hypothetical protein
MRTPLDDLIDQHRKEYELRTERVEKLLLEEGVLRDTLANDQKWDTHPAARERIDMLRGEKALEEKLRDHAAASMDQAVVLKDAVRKAIGETLEGTLGTPEERMHAADRAHRDARAVEEVRDSNMQAERELLETRSLYKVLDAPLSQLAIDSPVVDALVLAGLAAKFAKDRWDERQECQQQHHEGQEKRIDELRDAQTEHAWQLKNDLDLQRQQAETELRKLGLTENQAAAFWRNELEFAEAKVRSMLDAHERVWEQLGLDERGKAEMGRTSDELKERQQGDLESRREAIAQEFEAKETRLKESHVQQQKEFDARHERLNTDPAILKGFQERLDEGFKEERARVQHEREQRERDLEREREREKRELDLFNRR